MSQDAKLYAQQGLERCDIPRHMHPGVMRYLERGIRPGDFLLLMLQGQLDEARRHADAMNRAAWSGWQTFLSDYLPIDCHNTPEKVKAWMDKGGLDGREKQ